MTELAVGAPPATFLGKTGLWLAAPMAALQALNTYRTVADPSGFSDYMGLPLAASGDAAWVQIYGLRAAFIALLVAILILRREVTLLKWVSLVALVMPIGDAWLVWSKGGESAILARHIVTAVYIAIVFTVLALGERERTP